MNKARGRNPTDKKRLSRELFLTGKYQQKEIAAMIGTTEQSISRWAKTENWDTLRANLTTTKESVLANWYAQLAELNRLIAGREQGERVPTPKEADQAIKISTAIRKLETETGIGEITSVCTRLCEFIREFDAAEATRISEHFNTYIEHKMKGGAGG